MGSGAADKLKEIEALRASLGGKLEEIERRLPLAGFGKKAAAALAGSSVAGSVLAFGLRRVRGKRKKVKRTKGEQPTFAPASVTVNVFPKGAAWLAAAGLVTWAGVKAYDAFQRASAGRSADQDRGPAIVKPMPEPGRQTGN